MGGTDPSYPPISTAGHPTTTFPPCSILFLILAEDLPFNNTVVLLIAMVSGGLMEAH